MYVQIVEVPVMEITEGLSLQILLKRGPERDLNQRNDQVPKPRHVGPPWGNQCHSATALIHHFGNYLAEQGDWREGRNIQIL